MKLHRFHKENAFLTKDGAEKVLLPGTTVFLSVHNNKYLTLTIFLRHCVFDINFSCYHNHRRRRSHKICFL